ncbi:MAG: hypothetical protein PHR11_01330, partial [Candidatus Omnitrophica bacterium]|nr:hypothetical protein [Candidatus Omnitrophota bacterium]
MRIRVLSALCAMLLLGSAAGAAAYAQEIILLYTGETHGMLYPCNCPIEPDGGVARRSALVKQLRSQNHNLILVDSGGFFAGGQMDEYSQNTLLDRARSDVQVAAMSAMQYDAACVADDEFNFGEEFLAEKLQGAGFAFLSANLPVKGTALHKIKPYVIKRAGGLNVGIVGITGLFAQKKIPGMTLEDPAVALRSAIQDAKKDGAEIILVLSHQGEVQDLKLIEQVPGINILIIGHSRAKEEISTKVGDTLILRPSWQGRRLGALSFSVKKGRIIDYKAAELRLSDKVIDDPEVKKILPRCFSDTNCKMENSIGTCVDPGTMHASCKFTQAPHIEVTVIVPRSCSTCDTSKNMAAIKHHLPGAVASYLYYPEASTESLMKELNIGMLPAYLLDASVEQEKGFAALKGDVEKRGSYF